jgi:glycerol dehydrogenase
VTRIIKSPSKYVQGKGELSRLNQHIGDLGKEIFFIVSQLGLHRNKPTIKTGFEGTSFSSEYGILRGECSQKEVDRLCTLVKFSRSQVVVGIGGGKILDTAKAVAYYCDLPMVAIPTVASTDSPCSALSVLYKENGEFDRYLFLKSSPNVIVVDTDVIVKAPVRLLVAGMGDALATYFEARAVANSGKSNQVGGKPTLAATMLAKQCYLTLMEDGLKAKIAMETNSCTKAVENIIEVNIFLSSVGFESGGLGAAHAIQKGFTHIPELHSIYHGEKVACFLQVLFAESCKLKMQNVALCIFHSFAVPDFR